MSTTAERDGYVAGDPEYEAALRERTERLRERAREDYPDAWDFEHEPELAGVIESFALRPTTYGDRVVVQVLDTKLGRRAVWLSQTALRERFRELRPRVGEVVAIRYLGERESSTAGMAAYHAFRVELDRPGESFDWSQLDDASRAAPRYSEPAPPPPAVHDEMRPQPPVDDDIPF